MFDIEFEPLPPYSDPRSALRLALPSIRPPEAISITEAAERDMRVNVGGQWQPFRRDVTPYMVEPTDMIASREFRGMVFCGPSQSGKTQMLLATVSYIALCDPGRVALFQMTRDAAAQFERDKIAPMIRNSPALRDRLAKGRGSDTNFQKLFSGGTQLTIDWPTITKMSSATIRVTLGTDYDHFPESIDGEGDGFTLMRARTRSFMSRGSAVVESSPGAPLTDETWRAQTIHDCPPVKYGVLALYPQGSRARWYWTCPSGCGHEFEPHRDLLKFSDKGTPEERGKTAEMMCPGCGSLFGHEHKVALNQSGRWLHETEDGKSAVPLAHPDMRQTDVLSYWLNGAAAAFSTWAELITQELNAIAHFEATGDEGQLRTAMNTGQAMPYFPRGASDESEIHLQLLKDKAATVKTEKGIAPTWARYLTVSVDTQGTRFDVGVTAWGEDGRHQPIDRFDLFEPPADAPGAGDRTLRPFDIAEDWAVLNGLTAMVWPVEGAEYGLKPAALAVDMQGGGATTENAYRFYRERRRAGEGRLWHLTRGSGGHHTDRIWMKAPERARGGRKVASDIKILNMATDRLKDAVGSSLRIKTDGQNICIVPYWMTEPQLIEMTAERRTAKGWEKRPGMQRNESLDHLVQARALHIKLRGEKIDWANPPSFAVGGLANEFAVAIGRDGEAQPDGAGAKKHQRGVVGQRIGYLSRG